MNGTFAGDTNIKVNGSGTVTSTRSTITNGDVPTANYEFL